ncbi:MAG: hypothetical protein H0Z33_13305 [Bacillaceae bacterium]|nr:hypothetical protein [Bacillaceae bacterium]
MNLLVWIILILAGHLALYYMLGTENWVGTAFLATSVWAVVLYFIRWVRYNKQKEGV